MSSDRSQFTLSDHMASRRSILRAAGLGSLAIAGTPLLAACGSSSGGGGVGSSTLSSSDITKLKDLVGPIDAKSAGKGLKVDVGGVLAFSGPGAYFGRTMSKGMKLGAKHIAALGGPHFNLVFKDHKSGDPQAGVQAVKELGFAKTPAMLASYVDDLGAMFPGSEQYKIFSLDGGGGTNSFGKGKPFFWGSRANSPNDTWAGTLKWAKDKYPDAKKISIVFWDLGTSNATNKSDLEGRLSAAGMELGVYETAKIGATDYSGVLQKIKSDDPDILFLGIFGNDIGVFMKQYVTSGINKPVVAGEYTQPSADIAGSAYDGMYLSFDYFNAQTPDNDWSGIFIDQFKKAYGTLPDYYAANYYEDMFVVWELIRRVLAKGGSAKDGAALNAAFQTKPEFPSVYGGKSDQPGTLAVSLQSHSVVKRPMTLSVFKDNKVVPLAYFDIDGADYRKA
jgi:branched-chain amino acid transport system substrate-binding protein